LTNIYTSTSIHIPFDAVAFSFASRMGGLDADGVDRGFRGGRGTFCSAAAIAAGY